MKAMKPEADWIRFRNPAMNLQGGRGGATQCQTPARHESPFCELIRAIAMFRGAQVSHNPRWLGPLRVPPACDGAAPRGPKGRGRGAHMKSSGNSVARTSRVQKGVMRPPKPIMTLQQNRGQRQRKTANGQ